MWLVVEVISTGSLFVLLSFCVKFWMNVYTHSTKGPILYSLQTIKEHHDRYSYLLSESHTAGLQRVPLKRAICVVSLPPSSIPSNFNIICACTVLLGFLHSSSRFLISAVSEKGRLWIEVWSSDRDAPWEAFLFLLGLSSRTASSEELGRPSDSYWWLLTQIQFTIPS